MAVGSFFNSRLVERIGARRLSQGSLIIFILLSGVHVAIATAGFENAWSFCALQAATMLAFAFTGSNFGSISMEPFARGAGAASSFQACLTTLVSTLIGAEIGRASCRERGCQSVSSSVVAGRQQKKKKN